MSAPRPEQPGDGKPDEAEVIPIGTRGRPGRGTGQRPSSAARSLAAGAKKPAPKKGEPAKVEPTPPAAEAAAPTPPREPAAAPSQSSPTYDDRRPTLEVSESRGGPLAGIPISDWLSALTHAAHEVFGEEWEPQLARFLAFLRRRVTGDFCVDPYGFDEEITRNFFLAALRPIAEKWFRIEVVGAENIPTTGGALVVSNHSGTIPLDALMTMVQVHDHSGRFLRPLGADLVFKMPFVSSIARKGGATLACNEDAERMLCAGELVGVWPEGFKGIGKPFSERYKLQRFGRGGFVSAAIRTGVPIVPVSVVGAEEIYPLVGNVPALARILGLPYLPITPFFPLLGPLGAIPLPSKWLIEFGEPIRTDSYESGAADDPMLVFNVTDQVRETIQQTLFHLLQKRQSVFR
ncbi:lysophospholipid acyltransferase family protein [Nocardioides sp. Kera G14]|uniref:lysophospholipid acyltransferase family protein n=1 Tax=Nocardioides sp. Kera G14 TaxID=2884264 RepID=UPI001D10D8A1|nr:lysophospholipid acyltransferase family protein [Nocardioides sp. Kera G14]UDY23875.1 1-acyl-sn-glycerol-3-phosphate acyltransferase [Nocardioides sp. Kera G14]